MKKFGIGALVLVVAIVIAGFNTFFTVSEAEQALVVQFGEIKRDVREPGLNMKIPFVQNVRLLDKRILDLDVPTEEVIASDQKRLVVDAFARFKIVEPRQFYVAVNNEATARSRLESLVNSNLRQVLGAEPFSAVLSEKRADLMVRIRDGVNREAQSFGVNVVDVRIRRADLPEENSQAIYRRMETERQQEAKEFRARGAEQAQRVRAEADRQRTVLLANARRQSEILRGEGDGRAIKIYADAYNQDAEFYDFYRSMEAYRNSLTSENTTFVLSPASPFLKFLREGSDGTMPETQQAGTQAAETR